MAVYYCIFLSKLWSKTIVHPHKVHSSWSAAHVNIRIDRLTTGRNNISTYCAWILAFIYLSFPRRLSMIHYPCPLCTCFFNHPMILLNLNMQLRTPTVVGPSNNTMNGEEKRQKHERDPVLSCSSRLAFINLSLKNRFIHLPYVHL